MVRKSQLFILVFSTIGFSLLSTSVWASPATLKCNSNHDQVWVYDSLNSFNVDAKLKCGQGVEIIERLSELRENPRAKRRRRLRARRRRRRPPCLSALSRFRARRWLGRKTSASRRGRKSGSARCFSGTRRCELPKGLANFGFRIFKLSYRGSRTENRRQCFDGTATRPRRTETGLGHLSNEARSFNCTFTRNSGSTSCTHFTSDFSATCKTCRRIVRDSCTAAGKNAFAFRNEFRSSFRLGNSRRAIEHVVPHLLLSLRSHSQPDEMDRQESRKGFLSNLPRARSFQRRLRDDLHSRRGFFQRHDA